MKKIVKTTAIVVLIPLALLLILNLFVKNSIKTDIVIQANTAEVWDILMDHESYPAWNPFIKKLSGPLEVGEFLSVTMQSGDNKTMDFTPEVLVNEEEHEFRWKGKLIFKGIFDGEHYFILEQITPDQTRFIQGENFSGLFSGLLFLMIGKDTKSGFTEMNEALKARIESGKNDNTLTEQ